MKKRILVSLGLLSWIILGSSSEAAWFGSARPISFADLAERVKPAVVNISTSKIIRRGPTNLPRSPFGGGGDPFEEFRRFFEDAIPRQEKRQSLGTGFIINGNGTILTNNHVVGDADEILVHLADGRKFRAEIIGRDERTDLAVIRIKPKDPLPVVGLGNSDAARQGDWVMAMGNPFGFEHTVTVGVISAKGRLIGDANAPFAKFIQTDASINPGNSGGPLFNIHGEVIGINTMIYGMGTGIGFAIPINLAKNLLPQLVEKGVVTRGWLGVQIQELTQELAESYGLPSPRGVLIGSVFPGSPAEQGGLMRGDIVLEYDGKKVEDPFDLSTHVAETEVGAKIGLKVLRKGKEEVLLTIKIGEREKEEPVAGALKPESETTSDILGLVVRNLTAQESNQLGISGGVLIERVEPGSVVEEHDVHAGDLLLEMNDTAIKNATDYNRLRSGIKKGDLVRLLIGRGNTTIFIAFRIS